MWLLSAAASATINRGSSFRLLLVALSVSSCLILILQGGFYPPQAVKRKVRMQSLKARADGWEEMSGYGSALLFCRSVGLGGGLLKMKALKFNKMISDSQDGGHVTILENI